MLNKILISLAVVAGILLVGLGLTRFEHMAHADSGSAVLTLAGSGSGSVTPLPPSAQQQHDPIAEPGAFVGDLETAKTKGWFALVLVAAYGLGRALGTLDKKISWLAFLNRGKAAMILAGGVTVLAAGLDALFGGGSLASVGVAALWAVVGLLMPTKVPQ